jgi:PBP1b-binding outer membrane lipoprotein LpoB
MKRTALVVALALLLVGCSEEEESGDGVERIGSADVYDRIESMSDCDELQEEFDTAMDNVERQPAGLDARDIPMSYAEAAENRRQQLDC